MNEHIDSCHGDTPTFQGDEFGPNLSLIGELNFNDLLAEWLDSLEEGCYNRDINGNFNWIDICTWAGDSFDKFLNRRVRK